jgi:hypothetical protein
MCVYRWQEEEINLSHIVSFIRDHANRGAGSVGAKSVAAPTSTAAATIGDAPLAESDTGKILFLFFNDLFLFLYFVLFLFMHFFHEPALHRQFHNLIQYLILIFFLKPMIIYFVLHLELIT